MIEGTFSESWHRIANQRICLRADVKIRRQNYRGERWFVLENPYSNEFFRLRPEAYEFVARLRPDRTVQEVWQECVDRFPDTAPGQDAVIRLLSQLYFSNLLHYDVAADSVQLFERFKKRRQREVRARFLSLMFMRFPLIDPDRFLNRTIGVVGKLISVFGALLWLVVVVSALKVVVDNFDEVRDKTQHILAPHNLLFLYLTLVFVKTFHEFGHAYFCKRFGGQVHVMGVMLMIFTPIPYMDATAAWGFRSRWKRVLVGAAGMIVEVFVAALAVFVWAKTSTGIVHNLAYNIMFVASVSTIIFNINPLLRLDGYYILSDLLEIPNLHQRSTKQIRYLAEKYILRLKKLENPTEKKGEAVFFVAFGIASFLYRVLVFGGILLFVADRFLILGILMAMICLVSWVVFPVGKLIHYLAFSPQLSRNRSQAVATVAGLAAILLILLQIIPFPSRFRAPGIAVAAERSEVVNKAAGYVTSLVAEPGSYVAKDQPLLIIRNQELEYELASARAGFEETQARIRYAMPYEVASLKPLQSRLETMTARLRNLEDEQEALIVRARQEGVWVAPNIKEHVGRWIERGTSLGMVLKPYGFEFAATVSQEDVDALFGRPISKAEVRLRGQSNIRVPVGSFRVIPAGQHQLPSPALGWAGGGDLPVALQDPDRRQTLEPFFEVRGDLKAVQELELLHGRSGKIRFELEPEPLLPRVARRVRQLLQKRYQV